MCLRVFCDGDENYYNELKGPAMRLGSAFQKVNFLRDLKNDSELLGRTYFPEINSRQFDEETKTKIVTDIEKDFKEAYEGRKKLPVDSKIAVLVAYLYYRNLLKKLKHTPASKIREIRIRISNTRKIIILIKAVLLGKLRLI
jgi:phytoene/squalene synthetase